LAFREFILFVVFSPLATPAVRLKTIFQKEPQAKIRQILYIRSWFMQFLQIFILL